MFNQIYLSKDLADKIITLTHGNDKYGAWKFPLQHMNDYVELAHLTLNDLKELNDLPVSGADEFQYANDLDVTYHVSIRHCDDLHNLRIWITAA